MSRITSKPALAAAVAAAVLASHPYVPAALAEEPRALSSGVSSSAGSWQTSGGAKYYVNASGVRQTGWLEIDGAWYYFEASGKMHTGWLEYRGAWYYFEASGKELIGWLASGQDKYYFKSGGSEAIGWEKIGGSWYLFDPKTGKMVKGWYQDGSDWYYLGTDGKRFSGWLSWGGDWYWFAQDGKMAKGWTKVGSTWYHFGTTGASLTGWRYLNGSWYYFGTDGISLAGSRSIGGLVFLFDSSGRLLNSETTLLDVRGTSVARMAAVNGVDKSYLEPTGISAGSLLQFSDLTLANPDGVTAAQINDFIARNCIWQEQNYGVASSLRGQGQAFLDAANAWGVNVVYLVCHASIESAWGCSALSSGRFWKDPLQVSDLGGTYYNYFGYGAYDTDPLNGGMRYAKESGWTTPAAAIMGGAQAISTSWVRATSRTAQRTPYEMRWDPVYTAQNNARSYHQYASTNTFATLIGSQIGTFYIQEGIVPNTHLILPSYA